MIFGQFDFERMARVPNVIVRVAEALIAELGVRAPARLPTAATRRDQSQAGWMAGRFVMFASPVHVGEGGEAFIHALSVQKR